MPPTIEFLIIRPDDEITSEDLVRQLQATPQWDAAIQTRIIEADVDTRPLDATFVSAMAAGAAAIAALFTALGGVAQSLGKQKIVIRVNDKTLEVEGRNPEEVVRRLLPLLEEMSDKKVLVTLT